MKFTNNINKTFLVDNDVAIATAGCELIGYWIIDSRIIHEFQREQSLKKLRTKKLSLIGITLKRKIKAFRCYWFISLTKMKDLIQLSTFDKKSQKIHYMIKTMSLIYVNILLDTFQIF